VLIVDPPARTLHPAARAADGGGSHPVQIEA